MTDNNYQGILVIAEQRQGTLHKISYELLNKAGDLAQKLGEEMECIVAGPPEMEVEELIYHGASRVYYLKHDIFAEPDELIYRENLVQLIKDIQPEVILMGATTFGRSLAPRIAAALNTGLTADCTGLDIDEEGKLVQIRPAFSENILAHIKSDSYPQMATIRYREFPEADRDPGLTGEIIKKEPREIGYSPLEVLKKIGEQEVNIAEARVVVAGGQGLKKPEDFELLQQLADHLGGCLGASRDLVDEGFISRDYQVGYSGNRVKPLVYIACGISGAPQHLAGMKESEIIIAINSDASAPIFEVADYGIVGDLYEVIPALLERLGGQNS